MRKLNIKHITLGLALIGFASGCGKFLDVNENPNQPTDANPALLLPSAQAFTAHVLANQFGITGGLWAQYWTQNPFSSQYRTIERYTSTPSSSNNAWAMLYAGALQDYKRVLEKSGNLKQQSAIAYIMKAYTYQMITDAWGNVPLRNALNETKDQNIDYQPQEEVYDSIFQWIDRGLALANPNDPVKVGSEDLVFQGNMNQWIRFANTLKLRAYLRLSKVDPDRARAGVIALRGKEFLTTSATVAYANAGGNENPLFSEILGLGRTQNLVASNTAVLEMYERNDPRVENLYTHVSYDDVQDTIIGIDQGDFFASPEYDFSFPSAVTGALGADNNSATAPVVFISAAESFFLQAEAQARGWLTGAPLANYQNGIRASFIANNMEAAAAAYIASPAVALPATLEGQIEAIITQKWFAMNGWQTFEAWTEFRRTGYPSFLVLSVNEDLDGRFPARLPYPETEANTNAKFPGHAENNAEHLWWDVD